jgi:hypothetical protein
MQNFEDRMFHLILMGLFVMLCLTCFMLLIFSIAAFKELF